MKNQIGRTMVEMLGVLIIIGMITIGAFIGYSHVYSRYKISRVFFDISEISDQMYDIRDYWGKVGTDGLCGAGVDLACEGSDYTVAFTINGYTVTAIGLDKNVCLDLESDTGWADIGGEAVCSETTLTVSF